MRWSAIMKITGGRKFSLDKNHRPRVFRRQRAKICMTSEELRKEADRLFYGHLGPASPVRRIDPATGRVIETIPPRGD